MTCEARYCPPVRAIAACDTMSASRLRIAATCRAKVIAPKRSETRPAEQRATFAVANETRQPSEPVAECASSRRAARIAREEEMAALCQRRASLWAEAIRKGLDPDIARFMRDQAAAWRLLATTYARSARDCSIGQSDV